MKKTILILLILIALSLSVLAYFNILKGIYIFCAIMVFVSLSAFLFLRSIGKNAVNKGVPAVATIIKCDVADFTMSSGMASKSFVLKMEVSVTNEKGETWQTKMVEHIPDFQAATFQPGLKFKVMYDENNRKKVKAFRSVIDSNTIEIVV
ncbi:hypothetical protein GCM10011386_47090 [Parapedobacter defluvii]|uniref:DUF2393 domain-containing protein n=1 Tax=Parapedobacter defluvii TaxID=2045106 RepID=A0ABQ1MZ11_9SPHI|nr:hypothetical protein [Parapedobacter defluvii]GGC49396.1 hypothetical protein GCM10011386_47090 [Parapedobacter defluvii]